MKDLPRAFIYRDKAELDEFLNNNPLNEALYDVFLEVKDSYYLLKISAEAIFNEVYYQCTRLMLDPHPETRVWDYLNDAKNNTGWRYTSDLVFSMVYAVLSLQKNSSLSTKRFIRCLRGHKLNECYFPAFLNLVESEKENTYEYNLKPCPESPEKIYKYGAFLWSKVTDDYEQERIRMIVNLWVDKEDKLSVLKMIEDSFDYDKSIYNDDLPF